jgi:hypothetical protein
MCRLSVHQAGAIQFPTTVPITNGSYTPLDLGFRIAGSLSMGGRNPRKARALAIVKLLDGVKNAKLAPVRSSLSPDLWQRLPLATAGLTSRCFTMCLPPDCCTATAADLCISSAVSVEPTCCRPCCSA